MVNAVPKLTNVTDLKYGKHLLKSKVDKKMPKQMPA